TTVFAAEFIVPSDKNSDVLIQSGAQAHNVYTAAANVTVNANVTGDLYAAGNVVNVLGSIEKDLNAAGQNVVVTGRVGNNARLAGNSVTISGSVGGDILAAGNVVRLSSSTSVAGDVVAAGNSLTIDSPVAGKAKLAGKDVVINSKITGDVDIRASTLTFGPQSEVLGTINYKGQNSAVIKDGAKVGNINFQKLEPQPARNEMRKLFAWFSLAQLLGLFIAGWLLSRYSRGKLETVLISTSESPLLSLGLGILFLIVIPIAIVILFISLIGWYLAFPLLFAYLALLTLSMIVTAVYIGSVLVQWYKKSNLPVVTWYSILIGAVVYRLLAWVPLVGWLIVALLTAMAFGSMMRMLKPMGPKAKTPGEPVPAPAKIA
ncbi:MAG: hypothetical protein ACM3KM_00785, partial [Acidobacteriaceae bacterium]